MVTTMFALASAWVAKLASASNTALTKLEGLMTVYESSIAASWEGQLAAVKSKEQALAKANAEVQEAHARVVETSEQLAKATQEYASNTGAARLINFVRARAADGHYAKHLGLVATVRRDFDELAQSIRGIDAAGSESLKRAREEYKANIDKLIEDAGSSLNAPEIEMLQNSLKQPDQEALGFKRIVLYIDDLDRCPPDQVVAVLEAIHLLLAFKLFVVVVAIDVRWVEKALQIKYDSLLSHDLKNNHSLASPTDYLEKIFQVPYWVRELNAERSTAFMAKMLDRIPGALQTTAAPAAPPTPPTSPAQVQLKKTDSKALKLTVKERDFATLIAPCAGLSPRSLIRFMNVYRIIKAGLDPRDRSDLEDGDFRALMTLLAISAANPSATLPWIDMLAKTSSVSDDALLVKLNTFAREQGANVTVAYETYMEAEYDAGAHTVDGAALLKCARLARRYSFGSQAPVNAA